MYETEFQNRIADEIIQQNAEELTVGLTDNGRAVIVQVKDMDAAYTADEARELAKALKCTSDQRWSESAEGAVAYIRDLADVVDGDKDLDEIEAEWKSKPLNP